jgi:hypothetical protein
MLIREGIIPGFRRAQCGPPYGCPAISGLTVAKPIAFPRIKKMDFRCDPILRLLLTYVNDTAFPRMLALIQRR